MRSKDKWKSARFAWRPNKDGKHIEIWAYVRHKGKKIMEKILDFKPGDKLYMTINEGKGGYDFFINDGNQMTHHFIEVDKRRPLLRYMLWPYFGGKPKAVRNIIFNMELK
jgi:hypothetical protein